MVNYSVGVIVIMVMQAVATRFFNARQIMELGSSETSINLNMVIL